LLHIIMYGYKCCVSLVKQYSSRQHWSRWFCRWSIHL
jgi:hypothetical protein